MLKDKTKTMIFPYDTNSTSLLRWNELVGDYDFVQAVSLSGWGIKQKDASVADGGIKIGIQVSDQFENALKDVDSVLFVQPDYDINVANKIMPRIILAAERGKNIFCYIKIDDECKEKAETICRRNNKKFFYQYDRQFDCSIALDGSIQSINTSIICVAGLSEKTNKFEIQLGLRENLLNQGYKISQIGTRNYCELFGFHSFPDFMFQNNLEEWKKVVLFNKYVKKIELEEHPDVMIIGIPGATMKFNNHFVNQFGLLAYEISQAISPDVTILSIPYLNELSDSYLKRVADLHKERYGFYVECFNLANSLFLDQGGKILLRPEFLSLDYKFITDKIRGYNNFSYPLFNILENNAGKFMTEFLVNKLVEFAS